MRKEDKELWKKIFPEQSLEGFFPYVPSREEILLLEILLELRKRRK